MFLCAQLSDGLCIEWVEYSSLFGLSLEEGLKIGGLLFLASATAWSLNLLAKFILKL